LKQLAEKELDAILEKLCFCPNPSLHFCSRKSDKLALSAQVTAIAASTVSGDSCRCIKW